MVASIKCDERPFKGLRGLCPPSQKPGGLGGSAQQPKIFKNKDFIFIFSRDSFSGTHSEPTEQAVAPHGDYNVALKRYREASAEVFDLLEGMLPGSILLTAFLGRAFPRKQFLGNSKFFVFSWGALSPRPPDFWLGGQSPAKKRGVWGATPPSQNFSKKRKT